MYHVLTVGEDCKIKIATNEKLSAENLPEGVKLALRNYIQSYYSLFYHLREKPAQPCSLVFVDLLEIFEEVGGIAYLNAHDAAELGVISRYSYEPQIMGQPLHESMWAADIAIYCQHLFNTFIGEVNDTITRAKFEDELRRFEKSAHGVKINFFPRPYGFSRIIFDVGRHQGFAKQFALDFDWTTAQVNMQVNWMPAFEWVDTETIDYFLRDRIAANPYATTIK